MYTKNWVFIRKDENGRVVESKSFYTSKEWFDYMDEVLD